MDYDIIKIRDDYCVNCPKWEGGNIQYFGSCVGCDFCVAILVREMFVHCDYWQKTKLNFAKSEKKAK